MAINFTILNESNSRTGQVTLDFVYDVLASDKYETLNADNLFYFKMTTSKTQVGGGAIPTKIAKTLSDLALNGAKQSRSNTALAYTSITDMVQDYVYDITQGHTANKYSSGCEAQGAMSI